MAGAQKRKRLIIDIDPDEHRAIKARASIRGMTIREYVLNKLRADQATDEEDYDLEDVTESIKQGLREVAAHQRGEIHLPDAREFLESLENENS